MKTLMVGREQGRALSRTRVKTGPLPQVPWSAFEPGATLEQRLPRLLVAAFGALLAVQLWLHW